MPTAYGHLPIAQEPPNSDSKKTVLIIDSSSADIIYDPKSKQEKKNNADEICSALLPLRDQIQVEIELVTDSWREPAQLRRRKAEEIRAKNPDLIIIHASAFYGVKPIRDEDRALMEFVSYIGGNTRFLVYSRGYYVAANQTATDSPQSGPNPPKRLNRFTYKQGSRLTFRDSRIREDLRHRVSEILGLA
jgi:hypothetical protein